MKRLHPTRRTALALVVGLLAAAAVVAGGLAVPGPATAEEATATKKVWTCVMHPQIVRDHPGTCPICGMKLVPKEVPVAGAKPPPPKKGKKILYWVAPMDPSYRRDKPGKSPMGMDLVPVYAESDDSGMVEVSPIVVQDMGVRTALVRRGTLYHELRTIGSVVPAEDRLWVVNLRFSGWIDHLFVDETGVRVKRGQPLFTVYSPELVSAEQEYVVALKTAGPDSPLSRASRQRLVYYGVPSWEIARVAKSREPRATLTITAPAAGTVLHKSVVEGARVTAGHDLFRIADLSEVWVETEVYDFDAPWVHLDAPATMTLSYDPGRTFAARVTFVDPTLKVRLEVPNPARELKPGMFATVDIKTTPRTGALIIPTEAVIHSGNRELVFVVHKLGHYEAREITTGVSGADYETQVLAGLEPGERVVTSGQFLLDSESQLREAVAKMSKKGLERPPAEDTATDTDAAGSTKPADMGGMKMNGSGGMKMGGSKPAAPRAKGAMKMGASSGMKMDMTDPPAAGKH